MARRTKRRNPDTSIEGTIKPNLKGVEGGLYRPLSDSDMQKIDHSVRDVLENIGMSEAPPIVIELVTARGGKHSADGRLTFSKSLIDEALAGFSRHFTLHGQQPQHDILMSGKKVYVGTGGAAPHMVDLETGQYRDSTLQDLYDAAHKTERNLLKSVSLFDVYEGKNLPDNKKSYALSFTLQDQNKTLTDKQVDKVMNSIQSEFEKSFGAQLR